MTPWNERPQVIFGNIGEEMVLELAHSRGLHDILQKSDHPAAVDFIFADANDNIVEIAEVKTRKSTFCCDKFSGAYYVQNEQFKKNYSPILKRNLKVPFVLYVVDAALGRIFRAKFADLQRKTWCFGCEFPLRMKSFFRDKHGEKIWLRYYSPKQFVESKNFYGTEQHAKILAAAANVAVDSIDDSTSDTADDFITADDVIGLVKAQSKSSCHKKSAAPLKDVGVAYLAPKFLTTPNSVCLNVVVTSSCEYLYLPQLEAAGVKLSDIPRSERCSLTGWHGEFIPCCLVKDYWQNDWWQTEGYNQAADIASNFRYYHALLKKCLNVNLPQEWGELSGTSAYRLVNDPTCTLQEVRSALHFFATTKGEKNIAGTVAVALNRITRERLAQANQPLTITPLCGTARQYATLSTISGKTIELYKVQGCDKTFAHAGQLSAAAGYEKGNGTSDNTDFTLSVRAVAQYYTARRVGDTKPKRFLDVDDVPAVLRKHGFDITSSTCRSDKSIALADWWSAAMSDNFGYQRTLNHEQSYLMRTFDARR